ncbi:MAG: hypothetical protein IJF48_03400 [Clostridia bacterium]|nr:hypothetical protein [Clostridia bacterium]
MKRSFLNIITLDGKEIRIAEFGFFADSPSFDGNTVIFRRDGNHMRLDLTSGVISSCDAFSTKKKRASTDGKYSVRLEFTSPIIDGLGYCEMILRDTKNDNEQVLVRFMGCADSIGDMPFSVDSKQIVFFGYPADEFGE